MKYLTTDRNKFFFIAALLLVVGGWILTFYLRNSDQGRREELVIKKASKWERIEGMIEFEMMKTMDPALGIVPRERLFEAIKYKELLEQSASYSRQRSLRFDWKERGPNNVSGRTRAMVVDLNDPTGNTLWTGGVAGGIWVSRNVLSEKPDWEAVGDFFENVAIGSMAQDPKEPRYIYVGTGEGWFNGDAVRGLGIWRTANAGQDWEHLLSTRNPNFHYVNKMMVSPDGTVYAGTNNGLYRSSNHGDTWSLVLNGLITELVQGANGMMYCSVSGTGIFRSTSGLMGQWQRLSNGLPGSGFGRVEMAVADSDPTRVYAAFAATNGDVLGIFRTNNMGDLWVPVMNPPAFGMSNFARGQAWYDLTIRVDPQNPDRVFIGGIDLLVSDNAGTTWRQISQWFGGGGFQYTHADQHNIIFHHQSSDTIFFANDGGIYRTVNGSAVVPNIEFISHGYNVTQFYSCDIHPEFGKDWFIGGTQDNGTQLFESRGMNDTRTVSGGDGGFVHIDRYDPNIQISSYIFNSYYITNRAWAPGSVTPISVGSNRGLFINPTAYDSRHKIMYGAYNNDSYMMIRQVGTQNIVDSIAVNSFGGAIVTSICISPSVEHRVYFGLSNGNVFMIDGANGASPQATLIRNGTGFVSCVAVDESNEDHILVTYSNYGVAKIFETKNGGGSWMLIQGNLPDIPVRWCVFGYQNSNQIILATELGIWYTDQVNGSLTTWMPGSDGLGNTRVDMLKIRESDGLLLAGTHGRGMFTSELYVEPRAAIRTDQLISYINTPLQFYDVSVGNFALWHWDFGDGNTSQIQDPVHFYRDTGTYVVRLTLDNDLSTQVVVKILPNVDLPFKPGHPHYSGDFERNFSDFGAVSLSGSAFTLGNSPIMAKSGTRSGQYAWVLGLDEPFYQHNTIAAIYTPKFDMSESGIYQFSFWAKFHIGSFDGLQVEYSSDSGKTWTVLGEPNIPGWYNFVNNGATSLFERGQGFFSGREPQYKRFQCDISELSGFGDVAFRFVFKSGNVGAFAGIAIDDFEIEKVTNISGTQLTRFEPRFLSDRRIQIQWSTLPEFNCRYFEPEISTNGRDYSVLGRVDGNLFSLEGRNYQFTTTTAFNRDLYFLRLRVYNANQRTNYEYEFYSDVVVLKRNIPGFDLANVYSTLINQRIHLAFTETVRGNVRASIYSLDGKQLFEGIKMAADPYVFFDIPNFVPGIYVLYVEVPEFEYRKGIKLAAFN